MSLRKNNYIKNDIVFEELFKRYYSDLIWYATLFLSEEEAEDVVQDTFLELWKRRESIELGENISSYLYKMVYNKIMNVIARRKVEEKYGELLREINQHRLDFYDQYNENIQKKIENRELQQDINSAIDSLPEQGRRIFRMSYIHKMKNQEIANILGLSLRTVESHMYKSLKALRNKLKHLFFILYVIFLFLE